MTRTWRIYTNLVFSSLFDFVGLCSSFFSCSCHVAENSFCAKWWIPFCRSVGQFQVDLIIFVSMFGVHPLDASSQNGSLDQRLDLNNTSFECGRKMHSIYSIHSIQGVHALLLGSWGQPSTMVQFHRWTKHQNSCWSVKLKGMSRWSCPPRSSTRSSATVWLANAHMHDWQVFG
jgi:hypothetical protein